MNLVSSKVFTQKYNITSVTLRNWYKQGKVKGIKISDRKYLYDLDSLQLESNDDLYLTNKDARKSVIYARVSTTGQKSDLDHQIQIIEQYMISNGIKVSDVYKDIASGLNDDRKDLNRLISDIAEYKIDTVYITFKDRLTRFGFGYLQTMFKKFGTSIVVLNETTNEQTNSQQEITDDLIAIIHHYSMKLYSDRRKKLNEINKIIEEN